MLPGRRALLGALLTLPATRLLAAPAPRGGMRLPTPACGDFPTASQEAGPFYRADAPERSRLWSDGYPGRLMRLTGRIFDRTCNPVAGARVEVWHADGTGDYDNSSFGGRGYQLADGRGIWTFDTIETEHYSFRTAHYHVRVSATGHGTLTTQLYVPGHPLNGRDRLFDERLLLSATDDPGVLSFDFVLG